MSYYSKGIINILMITISLIIMETDLNKELQM